MREKLGPDRADIQVFFLRDFATFGGFVTSGFAFTIST